MAFAQVLDTTKRTPLVTATGSYPDHARCSHSNTILAPTGAKAGSYSISTGHHVWSPEVVTSGPDEVAASGDDHYWQPLVVTRGGVQWW